MSNVEESQEALDDVEGEQFGEFIFRKRLAKGGMGELFLASSKRSGSPVVIKRVRRRYWESAQINQQFALESSLGEVLAHKNIVAFLGAGKSAGVHYIAMEYIDGIDGRALRRLAAERKLPPDCAVHIAAEVCSALDYVHHAVNKSGEPLGIVHCDLSPGNVMIGTAGQVKILDFGIAQRAATMRKDRAAFAKPGYSSPEHLKKSAVVDMRSDIFSLGVVLYELLTGRRMFPKIKPKDIESHLLRLSSEPPLPSAFDPALQKYDSLILGSVEADPARRFPTALAFRDELLGHLDVRAKLSLTRDLATIAAEQAPSFDAEPTWRFFPGPGPTPGSRPPVI